MPFATLRWPRSLRARLLAVYGVGMALSALLVGSAAWLLSDVGGRHMLSSGAEKFAEDFARQVRFDDRGVPVGFDEQRIERWLLTGFSDEVLVRIVDAQGQVVFAPTGEAVPLSPAGRPFRPRAEAFTLAHRGVAMHAATALALHRGTAWYVQFAASDRLVLQMRSSFGTPAWRRGMVSIGVIFLVVFLVATHLTLQRMLKPLRIAAMEAQRITPQTLDARLQVSDLPDELAPMVDAFNHALDRLQAGFRTQQEFLANAAHELKTPLALIRAQIELDPPGQRSPHLLQDVDRMARQVQQLLHLAEASESRNYKVEDLDPHAAVLEVCDYMDRVALRAGAEIACEVASDAGLWRADRGALFTLLKNLLENAIQHSPSGGVVTVRADAAGFSVSDQGPGVSALELGRLFDRFWRSASRRDEGAGLGLSICLEAARVHGWRIEARPGTVGLAVHVAFAG